MPNDGNQCEGRREDEQQDHPEQEVRHRVEDQRRPRFRRVNRATTPPSGVRARCETDDDRDDLPEAEQQQRRPDPASDDLGHGPALLDRTNSRGRPGASPRCRRRADRGSDGLSMPQRSRICWIASGETFGLRARIRSGEPGHRPEQDEVQDDDQEDRQRRLTEAADDVPGRHRSRVSRRAGGRGTARASRAAVACAASITPLRSPSRRVGGSPGSRRSRRPRRPRCASNKLGVRAAAAVGGRYRRRAGVAARAGGRRRRLAGDGLGAAVASVSSV